MASRYRSSLPSQVAERVVSVPSVPSLSLEVNARFARQILLGGVGRAGQARVLLASAHVGGDGFAHRVAERYALRAGFAAVLPGAIDCEALAPRAVVTTEAARAVLAGSRAALAAFRAVALEPTCEPLR